MEADHYLDHIDAQYRLIEQENPTPDCESAAKERGLGTGQIVKSLIVETDEGLVHACITGDRELSESKFGEHRLADPEKSLEITGQESGTVHPFSSDLKHLVDFRVFENEQVSHTTGDELRAVIMRSSDFREVLQESDFELVIGDFCVGDEEDVEMLMSLGFSDEKSRFLSESGYIDRVLSLEEFEAQLVAKLVEEACRNDLDLSQDELEEFLERAESENHIQTLVNEYSDSGEMPDEKSGFDLDECVTNVLGENSDAVEDLESGKDSAINYLVGQVMRESNGMADPGEVKNEINSRI